MTFHLWSKGWSPSWATLLIPLLLISFPDWRGLSFVLLLTVFVFFEFPIADALQSHFLHGIAIIGRTLLLIVVGFMSAKELWPTEFALLSRFKTKNVP